MIEEKLQKCRVELQQKKLKKTGENKYAGFKYFELTDFLPIINEIFAEKKLFSNFSINGEVATLTVVDTEDKTSQVFTSNVADAAVKGCTPIQSLGAIHTYLKRYLYLNALEIVENDQLDALVGAKQLNTVKSKSPKITQNDADIYIALARIEDAETLKSYYNANKELVEDRKQLYEMVNQRLKALQKIKTEFGGTN